VRLEVSSKKNGNPGTREIFLKDQKNNDKAEPSRKSVEAIPQEVIEALAELVRKQRGARLS